MDFIASIWLCRSRRDYRPLVSIALLGDKLYNLGTRLGDRSFGIKKVALTRVHTIYSEQSTVADINMQVSLANVAGLHLNP